MAGGRCRLTSRKEKNGFEPVSSESGQRSHLTDLRAGCSGLPDDCSFAGAGILGACHRDLVVGLLTGGHQFLQTSGQVGTSRADKAQAGEEGAEVRQFPQCQAMSGERYSVPETDCAEQTAVEPGHPAQDLLEVHVLLPRQGGLRPSRRRRMVAEIRSTACADRVTEVTQLDEVKVGARGAQALPVFLRTKNYHRLPGHALTEL